MPRPIPQTGEPVNGDSFLDIVASVVSIMIIMVVMVGMKIKNSPVTVAIPVNPAAVELEKDVATERSLRGDMAKIAEETRQLQQEADQRGLNATSWPRWSPRRSRKFKTAGRSSMPPSRLIRSGPWAVGSEVPTRPNQSPARRGGQCVAGNRWSSRAIPRR